LGRKGLPQSPYTGPLGIWGDEPWQAEGTSAKDAEQTAFSATGKFTSNLEFADREKKKAFVESIASGNFHNQADKARNPPFVHMGAHRRVYGQREVTWEETLKIHETWDPKIDLTNCGVLTICSPYCTKAGFRALVRLIVKIPTRNALHKRFLLLRSATPGSK